MTWTIESIVDKIFEIERVKRKVEFDYVEELKTRFKKAVSSTLIEVPIKKIKDTIFDTDTDTFLNDLLKNNEVQAKISGFFNQYIQKGGGQKGGSGECCYFLFLCFLLSIVFNNMATLKEQCKVDPEGPEGQACTLYNANIDTNINTYIFLGETIIEGGRKRKRTKKKKRRKKRKGTKKRR